MVRSSDRFSWDVEKTLSPSCEEEGGDQGRISIAGLLRAAWWPEAARRPSKQSVLVL